MNAGVASRGSPTPRSMISMPRAAAACLACVSRTKGYVPCASRSGFTRRSATEALEELVAAHEGGDVDLLVAPVAKAGSPGPRLTASTPARTNSATGVHACLGSTSAPCARSASTNGFVTVTGPEGAWPSMTSSPWGSQSARSHASASSGDLPGG